MRLETGHRCLKIVDTYGDVVQSWTAVLHKAPNGRLLDSGFEQLERCIPNSNEVGTHALGTAPLPSWLPLGPTRLDQNASAWVRSRTAMPMWSSAAFMVLLVT